MKLLYALLLWGTLASAQMPVLPILGSPQSAGPTGGICGHAVIEMGTGSGSIFGASQAIAMAPCTPSQNETVVDIQVYINSCGGCGATINVGIFDSDGTAGAPKTVLCQAVPVNTETAAAWNLIVPVSCPTLTSGHTYYIVFNASSGSVEAAMQSMSGTMYYQFSSCSFGACTLVNYTSPNTFTATGSIYIDITP